MVSTILTESELKKLAQQATGREDTAQALEETLRSYVEQRISQYRETISRLEEKHGVSFDAFRQVLGNKLPLIWENEQDYMTWEEAVINLGYFEKIADRLQIHA